MSNYLIAFMLGAGAGTWIYNKMYRKTGGNQTSSLVVGGLSGFLLFLTMLVILAIVSNIIEG